MSKYNQNDGTVADPNAIVLGEEHTWIKLLYESGLRSSSGQDANLDLLVDPTSKTITLVVTTEIKTDDPLRGALRIRTAHIYMRYLQMTKSPRLFFIPAQSLSPNQQNDTIGSSGLGSHATGNGPVSLKSVVQLSPGSHASSSPGSTGVPGLGTATSSTVSAGTNSGGVSSSLGSGSGPKRDKKCTYCGIPFSNLDTLNAHMTHYCSRRPQLSHSSPAHVPAGTTTAAAAAGAAPSGTVAVTGGTLPSVNLDSGGTSTQTPTLGKSSSAGTGPRSNGSKRPLSRNGSTSSIPVTTDPALVPGLPAYTGQIPLFAGLPFDKLSALSTLAPAGSLTTESLASHMDYTDLSATLLQSILPGSFVPGSAAAAAAAAAAGSGTMGHDATHTLRASLAATMLPYLTRLLPAGAPGTLYTPIVSSSSSATPRSDALVGHSNKPPDPTLAASTNTILKSTPNPMNQPVDLDHGEKRATTTTSTRPLIQTENSQPELCHTPPAMPERLISSPLYCNGCQRFFASGQLYSCHLQMSYRLLKSADPELMSTISTIESGDREPSCGAFQLAQAASRLGLVLAAPLVTTNGIHYVPVHPSCGTQFEQNNCNSHSHPNSSHLGCVSTNSQSTTQPQPVAPTVCRAPKHTSPVGHSNKNTRDASVIPDPDPIQTKTDSSALAFSGKQSTINVAARHPPSKILDLSCSPQSISAFSGLGRETQSSGCTYGIDQSTLHTDTMGSTRLTIPNGTSTSSGTGPGNNLAVSSLEYGPYSHLLQLFTQLMAGSVESAADPDMSGPMNLPQIMAQLYSATGLYGSLATPVSNTTSSCVSNTTNNPLTSVPSSTPLIPLFAPFWLASHHDASGLPAGSRAPSSRVSQTPPTSPIRETKTTPNPMDLLASVYSTQTPGRAADLVGLGKSGKASVPGHANANAATPGHVAPSLQTSPTGSPESPNCRPFLCTYCQTRFQAYTTYIVSFCLDPHDSFGIWFPFLFRYLMVRAVRIRMV
ncbi:unnamed protein product [Echinostoma caproni]|uniref:C2H2-type domain-containing protein n=1 Tax=Echinostoma caproni TaxID=27848 RepID=A0A183AQS2_9TREM|nr:unnamed protein product [Echinostoma caproni]